MSVTESGQVVDHIPPAARVAALANEQMDRRKSTDSASGSQKTEIQFIEVVKEESSSLEDNFPEGGLRAWLVVIGVRFVSLSSLCSLSYDFCVDF